MADLSVKLDLSGLRGQKVLPVHKVNKDRKENPAQEDYSESKDSKEKKEIAAPLVFKDYRVVRENKEFAALEGNKEKRATTVCLAYEEKLALRVIKGRLVNKVL